MCRIVILNFTYMEGIGGILSVKESPALSITGELKGHLAMNETPTGGILLNYFGACYYHVVNV